MKKQGYNSRLDESLGEKNKGKKKQSLKSRRHESEGEEKEMGRGKFSGAHSMDVSDKKAPKKRKFRRVMEEYAEGELHSGSKKGPIVRKPKQAIAIAMSEAGMKKRKSPEKKLKVVREHLKDDMKMFEKEKREDKELMKKIKRKK